MQADSTISAAAIMPAEKFTDLYGNWVGDNEVTDADFEKFKGQTVSKLNIVIKQITDSGVVAQSVTNGNNRLMHGSVTQSGNKYVFVMDEPGDDKYDGRFEFSIEGDTLSGNWKPYDTKLATKKSEYRLTKKPFAYNANLMLPSEWDYIDYANYKEKKETYKDEQTGVVDTFVNQFYRSASDKVYSINSSKQKLVEKDLKNLRKLDLQILRNTIFARHGYTFKSRAIRQFFDQVEWYIPVSDNIEAALTQLEKDNIALLSRFEKYAEDNYDTFGR
ncbi:MAG: YARHG domain-containing protein [Sphingobacteriales bacterium]|nr:MAG: YARHG domain-containing protein [Sphingobacteriales bacterium]